MPPGVGLCLEEHNIPIIRAGRAACQTPAENALLLTILLRPGIISRRSAERCPSGLRSTPGERVGGSTLPPGFESQSLRFSFASIGQAHALSIAHKVPAFLDLREHPPGGGRSVRRILPRAAPGERR